MRFKVLSVALAESGGCALVFLRSPFFRFRLSANAECERDVMEKNEMRGTTLRHACVQQCMSFKVASPRRSSFGDTAASPEMREYVSSRVYPNVDVRKAAQLHPPLFSDEKRQRDV